MKVDFYIHGVPYGFSYKGTTGEKDVFFKRYYENRRGINEMRIEAINANGRNFYDYTYIIGKNVFDGENGRSGAYFGITVRLYQYYTKAQNLYYLLDSFFNSYLLNQIITYANNSYKFLIKEFDNNPTINQSLPELEKLIGMTFSETDLKNLNFNRSNGYAKIHFADACEDEVQKALAQYGEMSISYAHPSMAMERFVTEKNEEIQDIQKKANSDVATAQAEKEAAINEIKEQYADTDKTITELKKDLEKEKEKVSRLENDLKKAKEELDTVNKLFKSEQQLLDAAECYRQVVEKIKATIQDIDVQELHSPKPQRKNYKGKLCVFKQLRAVARCCWEHINIILPLLVLLLFILLLIGLYHWLS